MPTRKTTKRTASPQDFVRKFSITPEVLPAREVVSLRIDVDVLRFWRSMGNGYQSKINELLRAYAVQNGMKGSRQ